jgi:nucleolar protein 4
LRYRFHQIFYLFKTTKAMSKSTENTVFVRLVPTPLHKVMRHQIEDIFSQIGPIKKSAWINSQGNDSSKGYGFVRYVSYEDAKAAAGELHHTKIQMDGQEYLAKVELASTQPRQNDSQVSKDSSPTDQPSDKANANEIDPNSEEGSLMKKKSRIILRNLSFYAKESHIRKVLETKYGEVVDVHLPRVKSNLHVGFCFVTFRNTKDAQQAVNEKNVSIQKRSVSMGWSIPKKMHMQQKQEKSKKDIKTEEDMETEEGDETKVDDGSEDNDADSESDGSAAADDASDAGTADSDIDDESKELPAKNSSVQEKRTLFLRNLPFDSTRHDIFHLFSKFGYIESIYLVKDHSTGMLKGTAFVTYSQSQSAQRAMQNVSSSSATPQESSFVSQRQAVDDVSSTQTSAFSLRGRQILVDVAVDRETAETFDSKEIRTTSADRRNMYLQAEARVESSSVEPNANNINTWDDLPPQDQRKRQTALKDKTSKLQSPIFFINPHRLSFRNLGKHIDEAGLHQLIEKATKSAMEKNLITAKDQIAHWRALGELSSREILAKVQTVEEEDGDLIPAWEDKANIKDYIPSVFIDRDFGPDGKKANAPSRGFGFAEFTHHAHALACLRELNNNSAYSSEYAAGGKVANATKKKARKGKAKPVKGSGGGDYIGEDGRVHVPRLIVDFAVGPLFFICCHFFCFLFPSLTLSVLYDVV